MAKNEDISREQKVANILDSELDPLTKARKIIALGYDERETDALVAKSQVSHGQPIYYEQLPNALYDEN